MRRLSSQRLLRGTGTVLPGGWNLKGHQVVLVPGEEITYMLQALQGPEMLGVESAHPHPDTALPCLHLGCLPWQRRCIWNESMANYLSGQFNRARRSPVSETFSRYVQMWETTWIIKHFVLKLLVLRCFKLFFTHVNSHSFLHTSLEPRRVKNKQDSLHSTEGEKEAQSGEAEGSQWPDHTGLYSPGLNQKAQPKWVHPQ